MLSFSFFFPWTISTLWKIMGEAYVQYCTSCQYLRFVSKEIYSDGPAVIEPDSHAWELGSNPSEDMTQKT